MATKQELLTGSALVRLDATVATMPVIEQAKAKLLYQQGCDADQAFDLLRGPAAVQRARSRPGGADRQQRGAAGDRW